MKVLTAYNDAVGVCLNRATLLVVGDGESNDVLKSWMGSNAWIDVPCICTLIS